MTASRHLSGCRQSTRSSAARRRVCGRIETCAGAGTTLALFEAMYEPTANVAGRLHDVSRIRVARLVDREARDRTGTDEIIGASEALRRVLRDMDVVAPTDSTVLVQGETGTG